MKKIYIYITVVLFSALFVACTNDDVDKDNSVFDVEDLKENNEFDKWLDENFRAPYNIAVDYKFDFMDTDFNYNLTPPKFEKASSFAQIIKYCWFECYDEVVGLDFTRYTAPKEIYLIGSEGLDFTTGTKVLGTAMGGTRVLLYELNFVEDYTYGSIIKYMHIMHHEFSHILDQKKKMDPSFAKISMKYYIGDMWNKYKEVLEGGNFYRLGFVSDYATSSEEEDYAETYSRYLTSTDEQWEEILKNATVYDNTGKVTNSYGRDVILQKLKLIKEYTLEHWDLDLDELRKSVQRRSEKAASLELLTFSEFAN